MLKWLWRWLIWPCDHDWYVLVDSESVPLQAALKANSLVMNKQHISLAAVKQLVGSTKIMWLACKKCGELKQLKVDRVGR